MEPEGSLPYSQASATCPHPGPTQSSPHTHIPPNGTDLTFFLTIHDNVVRITENAARN